MKRYIFLSLLFIFSTSCVDVIDVDLPTETPRLVIEASLDWEKGTVGNVQHIKLSLSTPYFETTIPSVENALVTVIKNDDNTNFDFAHQNNGIYTTNSFIPQIGQSYTLTVLYNNETYTATETLLTVPEITNVYQSTEDGFDEELTEINVTFNDPAEKEDQYLMKFTKQNDDIPPVFGSFDDEFRNGNEITIFYERDDEDSEHQNFEVGDVIDIDFHAISKQYYDYMSLLLEQSEEGSPFSTVPVPFRGNCINLTNADNYAHGYFRVTEVEKRSYTIQ